MKKLVVGKGRGETATTERGIGDSPDDRALRLGGRPRQSPLRNRESMLPFSEEGRLGKRELKASDSSLRRPGVKKSKSL
jgi:hypothetical protein